MEVGGGIEQFHPVDQTEPDQHQVVTASGQAPFHLWQQYNLDEKGKIPSDPNHYHNVGSGKDIAFYAATEKIVEEVDVTRGIVSQSSDNDKSSFVSLHGKKKLAGFDVQEFTSFPKPTVSDLNISVRDSAWQSAIVSSGKTQERIIFVPPKECDFPDDYGEDNLKDFCHLNNRIYDSFEKGFVVCGTNKAVGGLLTLCSEPSFKHGTHGVIVDQSLHPSYDGLYEEGEGLQYIVTRELGKGSFGEVYYCLHNSGKTFVRKKILGKFQQTEVDVLMQLHHEHIASFKGFILRDGTPEIMLEYAGKSLRNFVNQDNYRKLLTEDAIRTLSLQGFCALEYMHSFGILHLDIKPENVCIKLSPPTLKLTDFGSSKTPQQPISFAGWTPEYMSPEACRLVIQNQMPYLQIKPELVEITGKADVYAFGLTICFMYTGHHIVFDLMCRGKSSVSGEDLQKLRGQLVVYLATNPGFIKTYAVGDKYPSDMKELLSNVLEGNLSERKTAGQAKDFLEEVLSCSGLSPSGLSSLWQSEPEMPVALAVSPNVVLTKHSPSYSSDSRNISRKDIKMKLRKKLRQKSCHPYRRESETTVTKMEESIPEPVSRVAPEVEAELAVVEPAIPDFAMLIDD